MLFRKCLLCCLFSIMVMCGQAFGWGPDGHHTVGAIADRVIVGSNAATQVKAILGDIILQDASVWADCAKGVVPGNNYEYRPDRDYPECKIFETSVLEAEMSDFVRRNDTNCSPKPNEESCHKQYHYTDVAIQHDHYDPRFVGTRNYDIVNALVAAMHVLKGDPAPAPFNFKDKREALLVLAHYVGDIHQPLHVGAVYLDLDGNPVDPDAGTFDERTDTHGGNWISVNGDEKNSLHSMWDNIPAALKVSHVDTVLLKQAKVVPVTGGQLFDWPKSWANDTLTESKQAFADVRCGKQQNGRWPTTLSATYINKMDDIKEKQLVKAGAHLAQLLQAIWP